MKNFYNLIVKDNDSLEVKIIVYVAMPIITLCGVIAVVYEFTGMNN
jgi:hypothetical protein